MNEESKSNGNSVYIELDRCLHHTFVAFGDFSDFSRYDSKEAIMVLF
jgi:hypothetical protein